MYTPESIGDETNARRDGGDPRQIQRMQLEQTFTKNFFDYVIRGSGT